MTTLEFLSHKYGNQGYKGFFYLNYILQMSQEAFPLSKDDFIDLLKKLNVTSIYECVTK